MQWWHIGRQRFASVCFLRIPWPCFHRSGDMVPAFQSLLQDGNGAKVALIAK